MSGKELYLRLLSYVRPYWRIFSIAIAGLVVMALTEPAIPALMQPLLDGSFVDKDPEMMKLVPMAFVALFLVRGVASYIGRVAINWVASKLVMDLRAEMFSRLIDLPSAYYDSHSGGNLISRVTYDVTQVTEAATSALMVLVKDSIIVAGLIGWMLYLNWKLTLIVFLTFPVMVVVIRLISRRLREMNRGLQKTMGDITHILQESIEAQREIKIYGGQQTEISRFGKAINWARRFHMKREAAAAANGPIVHLVIVLALSTIIYIASVQSAENHLTVGGFISFFTAMGLLFSPIKRITGINEHIQRGLAASESIFALIDEVAEPDEGTVRLDKARGEIIFENVDFAYSGSGNNALEQINLTVRPGETFALVGVSGSGKTSLASLVPRFYSCSSGRLLIDGVDIESIKLTSLRANIALVSQDVVLFNDSIRANIAYGALFDATPQEIEEAAVAAHVMDFARQMPEGLDTEIGDNGVRLSGGQRQRLAIARALLKRAPILILDEATASLDSESEKWIQSALADLCRDRTTLVIAHRLSTIESADRIAVLDAGKVVELGSHKELIAAGGRYADLHHLQFMSES